LLEWRIESNGKRRRGGGGLLGKGALLEKNLRKVQTLDFPNGL